MGMEEKISVGILPKYCNSGVSNSRFIMVTWCRDGIIHYKSRIHIIQI